MKKTARFTSILLAAILILGCFSVAAFAAEDRLTYLVLGDSIGFGSGLKNPDEANYGRIVADSNGYDYINDAVPGHTTGDMLIRISEPQVIEDIKSSDIISISIGGNNFLLDNLPKTVIELGVFKKNDSAQKIIDNFKADFNVIIATIKSYNEDALIIVQTLYNPMPGAFYETFERGVKFLNNAYRDCLDTNPGAFIIADVAAAFPADPELVAFDFIHPSAKGNRLIAQVILDTLRNAGYDSAETIVANAEGKNTGGVVLRAIFLAFCKLVNMIHKVNK